MSNAQQSVEDSLIKQLQNIKMRQKLPGLHVLTNDYTRKDGSKARFNCDATHKNWQKNKYFGSTGFSVERHLNPHERIELH